jgi:serpin B
MTHEALRVMTTITRVASVSLLCAACGASGPPEVKSKIDRNEEPSHEHLAELAASNTAFAVDAYKFAAIEPGNVFLSPHSITTTLAMAYAGANGATATQIADALHFDLPPALLHEALNALDLELESRGEGSAGTIPFQLQSASSVWGAVDWPIGQGFLDTLALNYDAGVHVVNFADSDGATDAINGWVSDNTGGKIEQLLPPGLLNERTGWCSRTRCTSPPRGPTRSTPTTPTTQCSTRRMATSRFRR